MTVEYTHSYPPNSPFFPISSFASTTADLVSSPTRFVVTILVTTPPVVGISASVPFGLCLLVQPPSPLSHHASWRRFPASCNTVTIKIQLLSPSMPPQHHRPHCQR
ncbi:hypothetical protein SLEP1_g55399 [Rubroshorea leprosula]|uniref:Uncharacterized protein n=1 Tax=Rubroshorea leprosula TaxID=152421 RepID=A0AAV5MGG8_9ROSI|nr:hypothetical protein SLEP1_g55399 [Rubroshorea leprosula]